MQLNSIAKKVAEGTKLTEKNNKTIKRAQEHETKCEERGMTQVRTDNAIKVIKGGSLMVSLGVIATIVVAIAKD